MRAFPLILFVFFMLLSPLLSASGSMASNDSGSIPYYFDRAITDKDIQDKSLRELSLMRNTIFARASNVFHKKWLHDYFDSQEWYDSNGLDNSRITKLDYQNAKKIAKREATIPKKELVRRREILRKFKEAGKWNSRLDIELGMLMSAMGESVDWDPSAEKRTPLEDHRLLDKLIQVTSIENLSGRDLRIIRNMIFARRGRPFVSEILQDHFGRMYWYDVDPNYTDKKLTKIDKKNIKIVLSVEESHGGPLTEDHHRAEKEAEAEEEKHHWYGAA